MATYTVTLKDLPAFYEKLTAARKQAVIQVIRREVKTTGVRLVQEEISSRRPPPVDRGTYRREWRATDVAGGASIYNSTSYAAIIEHGRRPGARMPPPAILGEWARRKGLLRGTPKGSLAAAQRSIGFVLARAIARRGIKGQHILRDAMRKFQPKLRAALVAALSKKVL